MPPTLDQLRSHESESSLFAPTSLRAALARLGFEQADPIRAPARAQDPNNEWNRRARERPLFIPSQRPADMEALQRFIEAM